MNRLKTLYGWKPTVYTASGQPQLDETVITEMFDFPGKAQVLDFLLIQKRIGQLAEGDKAWMRLVNPETRRIHGQVITNGTPTGRARHSNPNLSQIPAVGAKYGKECRSLFYTPPGKALVGVDLSGLELRCLAHYLAKYDGGNYVSVVCEKIVDPATGKTTRDVHIVNQSAAGLPTRDDAKTFIYALIYGAGDAKLGSIIGKGAREGKALRKRFMSNLPGYQELYDRVQHKVERSGKLMAPDGRYMPVRSAHSALNTLLQGCGAIISKKAMCLAYETFRDRGWWGDRVHQVLWSHDEFQYEVDPDLAHQVGQIVVKCMERAGRELNIKCPITGEYKVGKTWADTH